MRLTLSRDTSTTSNDVLGKLLIDGKYFSETLENATLLIPAGTYKVKVTYSPRFKKMMPQILDVPDRSGIRFHSGANDPDTKGCVLLGTKRLRSGNIVPLNSDALTKVLGSETHTITIFDELKKK